MAERRDDGGGGLLARWSRRKLAPSETREADVEAAPNPSPLPSPASGRGRQMDAPYPAIGQVGQPVTDPPASGKGGQPVTPSPQRGEGGGEGSELAPRPSLEDVKSLTPESDFKPFLSPGVPPAVRNAAMKKLFSDPRFNVMDRLDTYIDDYSLPDPIPAAMLRRMASAQFLNLFDQAPEQGKAQLRVEGDTPAGETVAESDSLEPEQPEQQDCSAAATPGAAPTPEMTEPNEHADPDLRLQPDHAAPADGTGRGAG